MARQVTFAGSGRLKTWGAQAGLADAMRAELNGLGYGVTSVILENVPASAWGIAESVALLSNTWDYHISITVEMPSGENPANVQNVLTTYLSNWFSNVSISSTWDTDKGVLQNVAAVAGSAISGGGQRFDVSSDGTTQNHANQMETVLIVGAVLLVGVLVIGSAKAKGRYR